MYVESDFSSVNISYKHFDHRICFYVLINMQQNPKRPIIFPISCTLLTEYTKKNHWRLNCCSILMVTINQIKGVVRKRRRVAIATSSGDDVGGRRLLLLRLHHALQGAHALDRHVADGDL
jgi:hypothetical protein